MTTPTNVFDYFEQKMKTPPDDGTLRDLPTSSPCGVDCVKAIDAMATYSDMAIMAQGPGALWDLLEDLNHTIEIFWRG